MTLKEPPAAGTLDALDDVVQAQREDYELPDDAALPFERRQVVYGRVNGRELPATLYRPRELPSGPMPVVAYYHGGGWQAGDRGQFARHAAWLTSLGFAGLCVTYRLSGEALYPACVQDAKCAVRWLRANAADLGLDADRIGVSGGSAGAHLAALLCTTGAADPFAPGGGQDDQPADVQAGVCFNALFEMPKRDNEPRVGEGLAKLFGRPPADVPELCREGSPMTHVSADAPPCLLLHGEADELISVEQARRFHAAMQAAGATCELETYAGQGHGWFNASPHFERTLERMTRFLRTYLAGSNR